MPIPVPSAAWNAAPVPTGPPGSAFVPLTDRSSMATAYSPGSLAPGQGLASLASRANSLRSG